MEEHNIGQGTVARWGNILTIVAGVSSVSNVSNVSN
jgi:hypothetical protein